MFEVLSTLDRFSFSIRFALFNLLSNPTSFPVMAAKKNPATALMPPRHCSGGVWQVINIILGFKDTLP